jgi:flagellum-specific peptidoglycan hydrolase FlgJ
MNKIEFINRINQATNEAIEKGALFNKAVVFAQAALESNWGNSELAVFANNLFAIKAEGQWTGKTIRLMGTEWSPKTGWHQESIVWRKYQSWTDCIIDYAAIITGVSWFRDAIQYLDNPNLFLKALLADGTQPGWATDPQYYDKITRIARELENYGGPKWA